MCAENVIFVKKDMKRIVLFAAMAVMVPVVFSCKSKDASSEMSVREALKTRHSVREFSTRQIDDATVLDILWAANGVNRDDGRRTAASAVNAQDIDLYVCKPDGTFRYDPAGARLDLVTKEDIRPLFRSRNSYVDIAPLTILAVSDQERFGRFRSSGRCEEFGYIDAGIVSANIYLYCTAIGLGTVCCSPGMDSDGIRTALGLPDSHIPVLYHPVGYPAE